MFRPALLLPILAILLPAEILADSSMIKPVSSESANANGVDYELVRFDWSQAIPADTALVLDNQWGNIELRQTDGREASLHAVMQVLGEHQYQAGLQLENRQGSVVLSFVYPDGQQPASATEGRIDAALLVPEGVTVRLIADVGSISSKKLLSPISIQATDQPIRLKSAGTVDISAQAADIDILFVPQAEHPDKLQTPQATGRELGSIQTIGGDITISYYPDMAMGFEMLSGRPKTTNDLKLLQSRTFDQRKVIMRTGSKPDILNLKSDTGYIRLINTGSEFAQQ